MAAISPRKLAACRENWKRHRGVTPAGRARLRAAAMRDRPWQHSTGPRTAAGKAKARRNSHRGYGFDAATAALRRSANAELAAVRALDIAALARAWEARGAAADALSDLLGIPGKSWDDLIDGAKTTRHWLALGSAMLHVHRANTWRLLIMAEHCRRRDARPWAEPEDELIDALTAVFLGDESEDHAPHN